MSSVALVPFDLPMTPPDTEAQEKLGIRYDFAPAPENTKQDEMHDSRCMMLRVDDWGTAPLTKEFVSKLESFIRPWDLERMRGRAVADHRNPSDLESLPINNRPACHVRLLKCRACSRGWRTAGELHHHKRLCHANREAYLKLNSLGLKLKGKCSVE